MIYYMVLLQVSFLIFKILGPRLEMDKLNDEKIRFQNVNSNIEVKIL